MKALPHRIHLVGVAGAGMSALAKILVASGHDVSGSDLQAGATLETLGDLGVHVWEGHQSEAVSGVDLVVASSAVPENDPELTAARAADVAVWRRPQLLDAMTSSIRTIGPSGTHGKTTTTALLVTALRAAGVDPSFIVGGDVVGLGTNAHLGADELLVLEVDEAFGTFEHVRLNGLVVTNVEADHLDHFGTADEVEESFVRVVRAVDGPVLACLDDPGARRVAQRTGSLTYGSSPDARWRVDDFSPHQGRGTFRLVGPGGVVPVDLPRPGFHAALNAAGALALLGELGISVEEAAEGLASFSGVRRRFESRGVVGGVRIVDDYAHHPTEVTATLREAASLGVDRVWAVFQPHLYSRTLEMHREFGSALALADGVVVTDVYGAREAPIPGVTGLLVASAAERAGASEVHYVAHRRDVAGRMVDLVRKGDLVVTMGAGDVTLVGGELAQALEERTGALRQ
ncbi:UDP-N-acetylmuramate--L-alanine ligase [soil metagenome]